MPRSLVFACALLLPLSAAAQGNYHGNPKSQQLVQEATALSLDGKLTEALARYKEAIEADPRASSPHSSIAYLYFRASTATSAENVGPYRGLAASYAREALVRANNDPLAQEVLRVLDDADAMPVHVPAAAALAAFQAGERLFHAQKLEEAKRQYLAALELDPRFALAAVDAGDCLFLQQRYAEAENLFRKATEIDPLSGQAWRFLVDALIRQGKFEKIEAVILNAIAARPSELPSWERMELYQRNAGTPIGRFTLVRKASAALKGDKEIDIVMHDKALHNPVEASVWYGYALARGAQMAAAQSGKPQGSPLQDELKAWQAALGVADKDQGELADEGLRQMYAFHKAGHLKAALMVLMYREAYRPDFEAWKKAEPGGLKTFIDLYNLRP